MNPAADSTALARDGSSESVIEDAACALADGQLVVFPTETVYGLGADGLNAKACERIFTVKGRPADHPVILHLADSAAATSLAAQWPDAAQKLAKRFWPGPMTLIVKRAAHVPDIVTGGQDTVGLRVPSHPVAHRLLAAFAFIGSGVIAAPSANRFGAVSPTRASDVIADIGDRLSAKDMVIDGGDCDVGLESTIVDVSTGVARILRPGGISRLAIAQCLSQEPDDLSVVHRDDHAASSLASKAGAEMSDPDRAADIPRVSGSLASHYAPRAFVMLAHPSDISSRLQEAAALHPNWTIACLVRTMDVLPQVNASGVIVVRMPMDAAAYAQQLYARLHDLDRQGVDAMMVEMPPAEDAWEAVCDRLKRAAA